MGLSRAPRAPARCVIKAGRHTTGEPASHSSQPSIKIALPDPDCGTIVPPGEDQAVIRPYRSPTPRDGTLIPTRTGKDVTAGRLVSSKRSVRSACR
jgi:hypothetical protein